MPDLTPRGLTRDGTRLVLVGASGEEFTVVVDHRFRAALRGPAQLETSMESALRPRDIQSRIRSGQSPETVAAAAQTSVDKIMGFATPVLAERAHVAERAQRATVRRRAGDGAVGMLGEAVTARLRAHNVDPEAVAWDAWRREDGRWTLVADYRSGESPRHAEFVYDAAGRYVVAEDDESRWLVGERSVTKDAEPPRTAGRPPTPRRLDPPDDPDQLPLGADAIELVTGRPATVATAAAPAVDAAPAADLTDAVAVVRALSAARPDRPAGGQPASGRPAGGQPAEPADHADRASVAVEVDGSGPDAAEADPSGPDAARDVAGAGPTLDVDPALDVAGAHPAPDADPDLDVAGAGPAGGGEATADRAAGDRAAGHGATAGKARPLPRPARKGRGRAAVPSWDEIMFGSARPD